MTAIKQENETLTFLKSIPMGIGQCILCGNWITGILILAGVAYSSWQAALWFLFGSIFPFRSRRTYSFNPILSTCYPFVDCRV